MKKLTGKRGETMVETLAAVLIVAVAAAMLATMVASAVRITSRAKEADAAFYQELSAVEKGKTKLDEKTVHISVTGTGTREETMTVDRYGTADGLTAYEVTPP